MTQQWRGVAVENLDVIDTVPGARLAARSRRLLGSLLRPQLPAVGAALGLLIAAQLALLAGPLLIAAVIDRGIPAAAAGRPGPLAWYVAGYAVLGLLHALSVGAFSRLSGRIGVDVLVDLRERVFAHLQRLSLAFHERYPPGQVISRLTSDLDALRELFDEGLDGLFVSLLSILGVGVMLLVLDVPLGLAALTGAVPLFLLTRGYLRRSRRTYRATRTLIARVIVQFVETMNGIRAVQAFRRERHNSSVMNELGDAVVVADTEALRLVSQFTASVRLVGAVSVAVILLFGGFRVLQGTLTLGALAAFVLYLRRFYDPLDELATVANSYSSAVAALEKISGVLAEHPTIGDCPQPVALPIPVRGEVVFDQVRFSYGGPDVLPLLDLLIPAGQTVALVGVTGAGKSTVAKLLARFYDPLAGAIRLDGIDLRSLSDTDLRRAVVMLTQESFLFSGSVADNIALGASTGSDHICRSQVVAAARAVGADEFITALPEGYDTDVRRHGTRLSAGQRQLVSLARALLADPAVLVLDEATSALDLPTERAVQTAQASVLAGRTALIIAHRLSTVLIADRVLVLAGGTIIQDGPPAELITTAGPFAELHTTWRTTLA